MSCTYVVGRFNHPNYGNLAPSNRLSKRLVVVKTVFCKLLRCYWFPNLAAVKKLRMHLSGVVSPKALPLEVYRPTLIDGFMKPKGLPLRPYLLKYSTLFFGIDLGQICWSRSAFPSQNIASNEVDILPSLLCSGGDIGHNRSPRADMAGGLG